MSSWIRKGLPLLVLVVSVVVTAVLIATGPEAERRPPESVAPVVEVVRVAPQSFQVEVLSRGTVTPRTQTTLVPEVAGRIVEVAPEFRNGGFFERGDVLLLIDPRDYENALTIARAELAQARLRLNEEEAQAEQARRDWAKLGDGGDPPPLVVRQPQVASARASSAAAEARLRQAELDLERARIRAPYAARVLEKNVDVGQYVTPGTPLASIYAVDYVEIRLPLSDDQQAMLDLPEAYRGPGTTPDQGPAVTLAARVGGRLEQWPGRIVRSEGAIDTRSRQLFVVAQVDNPYAPRDGRPPLKIGQFVEARIEGRQLEDVFVIPREAVRGEAEVLLVTPESRLERREITIVWRTEEYAVVATGLAAEERLVLTPLPFAAAGAEVRVAGEPAPRAREPG
jgi:RND family efflux transporter MFP subunit